VPKPKQKRNLGYYYIYRSTTSGGEGGTPLYKVLQTTAQPNWASAATYTDTSAVNGTTYYYQVTAVTISAVSGTDPTTTGGPESARSNEASATPTAPAALAAPTDLAVYATGSGKVTLYWSGVANATGYNVYRGTATGGEDYAHPANGTTPVTTQDTGPGVTNMFLYSNTGLTDGTEYFYTIKAANGTAQSGPSNEDSDIPSPNAVPWDTGSPSAIINVAQRSASTLNGLPYSLSYTSLRVMGPDGVIYQNGVSNALPPDGKIDPATGTMTLGTEPTSANHFLLEASPGNLSSSAPSIMANAATSNGTSPGGPGGGIRRVTSTLNPGTNNLPFDGVSGTYYLPTTMDTFNFYLNPYSQPPFTKIIDSPNMYVGLTTAAGPEIDAGIYFSPATTLSNGTPLPNRWHAFMRVSDGRANYYLPGATTLPPTGLGNLRVMSDDYNYIYADSEIGNDASLSFSVDIPNHLANLVVYGTDEYGLYYAKWYSAALHSFKLHGSLNGLRMKREVSLDQNMPTGASSYVPFTNAVPPHSPNGDQVTTSGYIATGSYMLNIAWQGGALYQQGQQYDWTTSYWDTTHARVYQSAAPSSQVVTLSPPSGDPGNETVSIHH